MESGVRWFLLVSVYTIVLSVRVSHGTANFVTCGSVLKLQHVKLGVRLHSHEVNYGSGSGQQVCACVCPCTHLCWCSGIKVISVASMPFVETQGGVGTN